MNLSYWEQTTWLSDIDFAIIGSGIVGLSCALHLREKHPKSKIVVFEKGMLPSGASTKNAGFACFGSASELLEDLKSHSEDEVLQLVEQRVKGLEVLRSLLGDKIIDYKPYGGYEVFTKKDATLYKECIENVPYLNTLLKKAIFKEKEVFSIKNDLFSFKNTQKALIFNHFEGQIDTGKMMHALIKKASENDVLVLNNAEISSFLSKNGSISLIFRNFEEISVKKLFIATNGFANQILNEEIVPARAQVLITKPITNLKIKGTFHLDRGYYYFRNIGNRILLGGGRNLDFKTEETSNFGLTELIQNRLEELLSTTILPNTSFSIDQRWSGIMGVGSQKKPIIKEISPNVYCGIRLGGMGVAIGSSIGGKLASFG
ncbi:NAD(P)/FAD-dependent oxidoreductase [Patiriisocius hiemis]|uniref:FAD-dependent oxidoreductase n=1 Tax=Patiriisocius hiemis TaxID=3075604 RepID=A0ABU2YCU6_9FLAO|nr:FAD-dependent oxidoreductase [Constantimarinum sp. W242]MDT0555630.1 FAD-dependent oxidoreductase [Constantimarinum sp. W242]